MYANILKIILVIALFVGLYHTDYVYLGHLWLQDDFNYCILIPIISLYLLWQKRKVLSNISPNPSWYGVALIFISLCFYWLGNLAGEYYSIFLSSWLFIVGLILSTFGLQFLKVISFPLIFILAMFPFPHFINTRILVSLKLISSAIAVKLMQVFGMSVFREGNIIDVGVTQLQVADACSGLRYVTPLIIIGLLMGYFYRQKIKIAIILALSAIPLSILMNSLRIAATGIMYVHIGPKVAEGFFHWFSGLGIFTISILFLWFEMNIISRILDRVQRVRYEHPNQMKISKIDGEIESKNIQTKRWRLLYPPQLWVSILLIGLTLVVTLSMSFTKKIPSRQALSYFPMKIGQWTGTRKQMDKRFWEKLDLSDYLLAIYTAPNGKYVNLYIAYYESQRKGESIHSPSTCLPGSGWVFIEEGVQKIKAPGLKLESFPVRYVVMEKGASKQIAYYWFYLRGRIVTSLFQVKLYNLLDGFTKHRTDGALIRVVTPIYEGENIRLATRRLDNFLGNLIPVLTRYLPEK